MSDKDLIVENARWILKMQHGMLTPHMRETFTALTDAAEAERKNIQSLAKWVGVSEDTTSLEIACEVSSALEARQVDEAAVTGVISQATYDWSKQRLEYWRRPNDAEDPGNFDSSIARAVVEFLGDRP